MYQSDARKLHYALHHLVELVETALDAGQLLSPDGKRPTLQALREAREVLAELEERGYRAIDKEGR